MLKHEFWTCIRSLVVQIPIWQTKRTDLPTSMPGRWASLFATCSALRVLSLKITELNLIHGLSINHVSSFTCMANVQISEKYTAALFLQGSDSSLSLISFCKLEM